MSAELCPLVAPTYLIRSAGVEHPAREHRHNLAWNEARFVSFDSPSELVRVDGGGRTSLERFEDGRPVARGGA